MTHGSSSVPASLSRHGWLPPLGWVSSLPRWSRGGCGRECRHSAPSSSWSRQGFWRCGRCHDREPLCLWYSLAWSRGRYAGRFIGSDGVQTSRNCRPRRRRCPWSRSPPTPAAIGSESGCGGSLGHSAWPSLSRWDSTMALRFPRSARPPACTERFGLRAATRALGGCTGRVRSAASLRGWCATSAGPKGSWDSSEPSGRLLSSGSRESRVTEERWSRGSVSATAGALRGRLLTPTSGRRDCRI